MNDELRWDPCISHHGSDVVKFIEEYFGLPNRRVLLLAGAGFDPRSINVAVELAAQVKHLQAMFIRENRPNPDEELLVLATRNVAKLEQIVKEHTVLSVDIFGNGGAVTGGRNIISHLRKIPLEQITDVVIDISALSVGTSFPTIRYFVELIGRSAEPINLHVVVAHNPTIDAGILAVPSDAPGYVHGFRGRSTLDSAASVAKLWLPQLAAGRRNALATLFDFISPHDTCPIFPFPARDPQLVDALAEEYLVELENTWEVDTRNIVYADEGDPLDLYRTILKLDDLRRPVFTEVGGSLLILSPLGSKVMALGALMAALERDLPVAHLETLSYHLPKPAHYRLGTVNLIHVWLEGEAYPAGRATLQASGVAKRGF